MQLPSRLKIGGHTFTVIRADLTDKAGTTDYCAQTIAIEEGLQGSVLMSTLIHEAIHVMNSALEETLVDSLAEQIYQFLAENGFLAGQFDTVDKN